MNFALSALLSLHSNNLAISGGAKNKEIMFWKRLPQAQRDTGFLDSNTVGIFLRLFWSWSVFHKCIFMISQLHPQAVSELQFTLKKDSNLFHPSFPASLLSPRILERKNYFLKESAVKNLDLGPGEGANAQR